MVIKNKFLTVAMFVALSMGTSLSAVQAANWQPRIPNAALPPRIVAVDKSQQQFYLYNEKQDNLLELAYQYPCTTGQKDGDKEVVNDLRTPEGVYFVVYKIAKGLDFKEYGGIAYTLNYPNPVDKLRGKTGYGIWIHSKGDGITPKVTKGCIAIDLDNIDQVGPLLTSGTAVVVGETLDVSALPSSDDGTAKHLRRRMEQWTRAWADRSQDFFDFYDGASYSKAMPETFKAFRSNKERLFKRLDWINIFNRQVHVLEGPGYWVTWSEQYYRAPNLSTEGIRRLYWQRDADNVFRIVGMEWIPSDLGMQAAFEKGELVASTAQLSDAQPSPMKEEKPIAPPLSMPESDAPEKPVTVAVAEQKNSTPEVTPEKETDTKNINQGKAATILNPLAVTPKTQELLGEFVTAWQDAWKERDAKAFYAFYNEQRYGKEAGQKYSEAFKDLQRIMAPYFKAPWIELASTAPRMEAVQDMVMVSMQQWIFIPSQDPRQGEHILYWKQNEAGKWRIVASEWLEKPGSMQVAYLEKVSAEVGAMLEQWRKDWLAADVNAYVSHYATHARQGGRNKNGIALQKKRLWQKNPPARIELSGMRVLIDAKGIQVDMTQVYEGTDGRGDKGVKILLLVPTSEGWKIASEEWTKSP